MACVFLFFFLSLLLQTQTDTHRLKQTQTGIPEPTSWCPNLEGYLSKYPHLARIFVGSPAKCGGTTVNNFFNHGWKWKDSNLCAWSISGSGIGKTKFNQLPSLQHLISLQCKLLHDSNGRQTLFLIPVREKISSIRSATRYIVEKRGLHQNDTSFDWVSERPFELARSPADVVEKYQLIYNNMMGAHVLIFDYTHIDSILACLPGQVRAVRTSNMTLASLLVSKANSVAPMHNNAAHKNTPIAYPNLQSLEKLYDTDGVGMQRWKSVGTYIEAVSGPVPQCLLASWHGNVLTCVV